MKKTKPLMLGLLALLTTACGSNTSIADNLIDVNFIDGTTTIKTVKVESGKTITRPSELEEKAEYDFVNWFATPSKSHKFDFTQPIIQQTNVYAGFTKYQEDIRDWYILGSGTSKVLLTSDWGKVYNEEHTLTRKTADKNEYTITLDLLKGDEFQFGGEEWVHKRGFGYFETITDDAGLSHFSSAGGLGEVTAKGSNTKVEVGGNYTFTLTTYPGDDTYNTSAPGYTEANKEIYNIGTYDTIKWVRNGDPIDVVELITDIYIKGSGITNWLDYYNANTKFTRSEDGKTYTYKNFLKANEEFLLTSRITDEDGNVTTGTIYVKYDNLNAGSKELFSGKVGGNLVAKDSGEYNFTYYIDNGVLAVTFDASVSQVAADYYLTGKYGTSNWDQVGADFAKAENKFTRDSNGIHSITFDVKKDDQFNIEALKSGAVGRGNYGESNWSQLGNYNTTFMAANTYFVAADLTGQWPNYNFKAVADGTYTFAIDEYSKIVTITASV